VLILNYKTKFVNRMQHTQSHSVSFTQGQKHQPHMKSNTFWPFSYLKTPINYVFVPFLSLSVIYARRGREEDETQDESERMQLSKMRLFSWVKSAVICHPSRAAWQKYQGHLI
jgi:hypothetical protein